MIESQLMTLEWREQTNGNFSVACDVKFQTCELTVPFMGHSSVIVRLPSNLKVNTSKSASDEVVDDALTELWILHTRPTTLMS